MSLVVCSRCTGLFCLWIRMDSIQWQMHLFQQSEIVLEWSWGMSEFWNADFK